MNGGLEVQEPNVHEHAFSNDHPSAGKISKCWGCGGTGHSFGDSLCPAAKGVVHVDAHEKPSSGTSNSKGEKKRLQNSIISSLVSQLEKIIDDWNHLSCCWLLLTTELLDVTRFIGIDTDSGRSMSTERSDFLTLDTFNLNGEPRIIIDDNAIYIEPGTMNASELDCGVALDQAARDVAAGKIPPVMSLDYLQSYAVIANGGAGEPSGHSIHGRKPCVLTAIRALLLATTHCTLVTSVKASEGLKPTEETTRLRTKMILRSGGYTATDTAGNTPWERSHLKALLEGSSFTVGVQKH